MIALHVANRVRRRTISPAPQQGRSRGIITGLGCWHEWVRGKRRRQHAMLGLTANTRCSVCRFDPGGLHVQLRLAPGTGLQSPETGSQNRRYRDLSWRQRPHVPRLNPRKCPQIAGYLSETGKHRFASDCVVVAAARIEPVSTLKFPASREFSREFFEKRASEGDSRIRNANSINRL